MTKARWAVVGVVYVLLVGVAFKWAPILFFPLFAVPFFTVLIKLSLRQEQQQAAKNEALFVSMFPDLQPWYHPAKLYDYSVARLAQSVPRAGRAWKGPPGFAALEADIGYEAEREVVRLLDSAGTLLSQFIFETHPEGAAIRVGKGKFTVSTDNPKAPRVRYWHPDREFKWTPGYWRFKTTVADRPFETSDRGTSFSSDSSSSSLSSRAASAAPFAAAGGTFDGGGASSSWSEGGASAAASTSPTSY